MVRSSAPAALLAAVLLIGTACGSDQADSGDRAQLDGVQRLDTFEASEIAQNEVEVAQTGDDTVRIEFAGRPICSPDRLAQEPGSVVADYTPSQISITIDPQTQNCREDADAAEFRAGITLQLTEDINGRDVLILVDGEEASLAGS